ncbi:menaquinone reductase molybdopterin-binding-like subunit QrcB [Desulfoluna butyratoxydans]|uniref:Molybdopterin oxidoreductase n=1 Tax=Desulfoluna butyratoxydans TaxID=231438 RepID=A0A4U8YKZ6_9BACT|nr:menaquinone reductase molybdopterin-binding-like subunit QrcB [Desulfoluna butyratoxydans]VFQ44197.1 molybdopterin oxidoreductase [Desulfoluna butyratoxydans]
MKINRRHFLALGMGATAGTLLSPLPWKLTDDVSIWTQNWSWTPVPETGEYYYVGGACTLCPGGCSLAVRKVGERVVKIEGSPESAVNSGDLCGIGISATQLLYGPSRIEGPMVRAGKRGEGKWNRISWEEAEAQLAEKLGSLSDGKGVAALSASRSGSVPALFQRLLDTLGSDRFLTLPSVHDTLEQAMAMTMGRKPGEGVGFDTENTDLILSLGSAVAEGWGAPVRMVKAAGSKKMIQVEPYLSTTASMADMWVPAKPGSEGVFALSVAAAMVQEKLYDHIFVSTATEGFDAFSAWLLENYAPDKAEAVTGVAPAMVKKVAVAFAGARRPVAICGRGKGETPVSLAEALAVFALNALKGSVQRDGGLVKVGALPYAVATAETADLGAKLAELTEPGKTELLMDWGTNPFYTLATSDKAKESLAAIGTIVSFSPYMDETAAMADLILPDHTHLEKLQDVPVRAGLERPTVNLAQPAIDPVMDTKHTGDVLISVGAQLEGGSDSFGWDDYETYLEESCGEMWETLYDEGTWQGDIAWKKGLERILGTSQRFTFVIPEGPVALAAEGAASGLPFTLVPRWSLRIASGPVADAPFTMKTISDRMLTKGVSHVELHPKTARQAGLKDGDTATLSTPFGSAKVVVTLFEGVMPGVVALAAGLGHTAFDDYIGGKGASYTALSGSMADPATGLNCTWGAKASLAKG